MNLRHEPLSENLTQGQNDMFGYDCGEGFY